MIFIYLAIEILCKVHKRNRGERRRRYDIRLMHGASMYLFNSHFSQFI